jgi:hypothetical protein
MRHVEIISHQKRRLQKPYNVDSIGPSCSNTHAFCKTCENCQKVGFISKHRESLDNLLLTLKSHYSGDVYRAIHDLWPHFHKEHD